MNNLREVLKLYAVTDRPLCEATFSSRESPLPIGDVDAVAHLTALAINGGVTIVQLREKKVEDESFLCRALALKTVTDSMGVPLIINDNVFVALESGASGVHLGQSDADIPKARKVLPSTSIIGASVHSVEEALRAEAEGADYLGVGALFPTGTKTDVCQTSIQTLRHICASVQIPVVGIGGISVERIALLGGSGIAGVAVVSALFGYTDCMEQAKKLRAAVDSL